MKIVKKNSTKDEMLLLIEALIFDAKTMNSEDFINKYDSFEIPEQLITAQFETKRKATVLHMVMRELANEQNQNIDMTNLTHIFKFLIENGADLNIMDSYGSTPLGKLFQGVRIYLKDGYKDLLLYFKIISQANIRLSESVLHEAVSHVFDNKDIGEYYRDPVLDLLVDYGVELTMDDDVAMAYNPYYHRYKSTCRQNQMFRGQKKLAEQVMDLRQEVRSLAQQNQLLLELVSQTLKRVESLPLAVGVLEETRANPVKAHKFFGS